MMSSRASIQVDAEGRATGARLSGAGCLRLSDTSHAEGIAHHDAHVIEGGVLDEARQRFEVLRRRLAAGVRGGPGARRAPLAGPRPPPGPLRVASLRRLTLRRSSSSVFCPNHWNGVCGLGTNPPTEAEMIPVRSMVRDYLPTTGVSDTAGSGGASWS